MTIEFIKLRAQENQLKKQSKRRGRRKKEPGDVALARERGGLAQNPEANRNREEKRGASWGEELERENGSGLFGIRIVQWLNRHRHGGEREGQWNLEGIWCCKISVWAVNAITTWKCGWTSIYHFCVIGNGWLHDLGNDYSLKLDI